MFIRYLITKLSYLIDRKDCRWKKMLFNFHLILLLLKCKQIISVTEKREVKITVSNNVKFQLRTTHGTILSEVQRARNIKEDR